MPSLRNLKEFREASPCQASRPSHVKKSPPNCLQMPSARGGDEERQRRGMHKMCEGGDRRRVKEAACGGRRTRKNTRENRREANEKRGCAGRKRADATRKEKRSGESTERTADANPLEHPWVVLISRVQP